MNVTRKNRTIQPQNMISIIIKESRKTHSKEKGDNVIKVLERNVKNKRIGEKEQLFRICSVLSFVKFVRANNININSLHR